jgi:NDP-sugar pyrophosphorylase family protein
MKAMVLAAGLGTRLRPLTDDRPKALVEVAGRTMLDLTLARLRSFGIEEVIVNVFHLADMILDYLDANENFGMRVEISREETLLDTGGGLKQAAWFFNESAADKDQPFLLHNVDILSSFDLVRMADFHRTHHPLATLATQNRKTSRPLLFHNRLNEELQLCGRANVGQSVDAEETALAFAGIHVLSPQIFDHIQEDGAFSIITTYLRIAAAGGAVLAYRDDAAYWRDLGKPENVQQAAADLQVGVVVA